MAVTCKWSVKLATAKQKENNKVFNYTLYGGGNVPFVLCYENKENNAKQMVNFAMDTKAIKDVLQEEFKGWRGLYDLTLYPQADKQANKDLLNIIKSLIELNIPFKFKV